MFSFVFLGVLFVFLFFFGFFTRKGFLNISAKYPLNPPKSFPCEFSLLGPPSAFFICPGPSGLSNQVAKWGPGLFRLGTPCISRYATSHVF